MALPEIPRNGTVRTPAGPVAAPGLEGRLLTQDRRIGQGLATGSLTPDELRQVQSQRAGFYSSLTEAKADDGRVDLQERKNLHSELNALSASLYGFKHDTDPQGPRPGCRPPQGAPPPEGRPPQGSPPPEGRPPQGPPPRPGCPPPGEGPLGEKESFTASITGDPHFAVDGSINGEDVNATFDNQDLGTRTQYAGAGFKLDTTTVPWGDSGAAVVGSATVTTGFGPATDRVTVNADGSVLVNGEAVSLESGETMGLNRTSSLSYNEDGSYSVSSRNGKVTNTFTANESENGNYLNITSSVDDVQTVGWLQNQV